MAILRLEDICYGYEDGGYRREILKHLSYEFEEGEFIRYWVLAVLVKRLY